MAADSNGKTKEGDFLLWNQGHGKGLVDYTDKFMHSVKQGATYILCNYLEKVDESMNFVQYKLKTEEVIVHPEQICFPWINISETFQKH